MRTFCEFVEQRDKAINLVEQAIDKIYEEAEKNPTLKEALIKEGMWGDIGQAISSGWKGLWGGAKAGGQAAWAGAKDALFGQKAYYDAVMKNLAGLIKAVPAAAATTGQDRGQAMQLVNWLQTIHKNLELQAPQFQRAQTTYTPAGPGSKGGGVATTPHTATPAINPATGAPYPVGANPPEITMSS